MKVQDLMRGVPIPLEIPSKWNKYLRAQAGTARHPHMGNQYYHKFIIKSTNASFSNLRFFASVELRLVFTWTRVLRRSSEMAFVSLKTISWLLSCSLPVTPGEKDIEDNRYGRPAVCLASCSIPAFAMMP